MKPAHQRKFKTIIHSLSEIVDKIDYWAIKDNGISIHIDYSSLAAVGYYKLCDIGRLNKDVMEGVVGYLRIKVGPPKSK